MRTQVRLLRRGKRVLNISHKRKLTRERVKRFRARKALLKLAPNLVPALAVVGTYEELLIVLAKHRHQLGLSQLAVDDLAGFQSGYTGHLERGPASKHGRGLGRMSLPTLLDTYGLRLAIVEKASTG